MTATRVRRGGLFDVASTPMDLMQMLAEALHAAGSKLEALSGGRARNGARPVATRMRASDITLESLSVGNGGVVIEVDDDQAAAVFSHDGPDQ